MTIFGAYQVENIICLVAVVHPDSFYRDLFALSIIQRINKKEEDKDEIFQLIFNSGRFDDGFLCKQGEKSTCR